MMACKTSGQVRSLLSFLVMLATACGCQSTHYDSLDAAALAERNSYSTQEAARGEATPPARSPSVISDADYDDASESGDSGRAGEPAHKPRRLTLASYREGAAGNRSAVSGRSPAPGNHMAAGGGSSLALSLTALQDQQPADGDKAAAKSESSGHTKESLAEITNKLNNPGADLAQLNFKLTWNQYQGSLGGNSSLGETLKGFRKGNPIRNLLNLGRGSGGEGPSSQNSLTLNFQPVFPFKLSNGDHIIVRPSIPITWKPHYNARSNGFDEDFGLGDAQTVAFYSRTDAKKGFMWGAGLTMQFPTHTDDVLGNDAFMMGPAGFVGRFGKWGSVGVFPQHWWNIGGGDGYTSLTAIQPWYWFNVGEGYQLGGAPIITYDWANDDSDNNLTVPVNLGAQKTFLIGKLPVKVRFEGIYYAVTPDEFGPQWGLNLTFTPVIPNPFEKHAAAPGG